MGCGCNNKIKSSQDPYMGKTVRLKNGDEGRIYTKLLGGRPRYSIKNANGDRVDFYLRDIKKIIS